MKKHIFVSGGLGNQMFQYAFYLSCKQKGIPCILDTSEFILNPSHNGFELEKVFGLKEEIYSFPIHNRVFYYAYKKIVINRNRFPEKIFSYCDNVYNSRYKYYDGNWLCSDYFADIEKVVREKYVFTNIDVANKSLATEISASESVSIHIRRGDYLKLPYYCVCNEAYYQNSIKEICSRIATPSFYVFSDDIIWSDSFMKKMGVSYQIISCNPGAKSFQDMFLMSQCKHNIIANSTFSWWGAWLNTNPQKIVIGPYVWFTNINARINWPGWILIRF